MFSYKIKATLVIKIKLSSNFTTWRNEQREYEQNITAEYKVGGVINVCHNINKKISPDVQLTDGLNSLIKLHVTTDPAT